MHLSITKEQLLTGLQAVQNIVGSRTTLPILSNVLLRAAGDRLELTATDMDVTISCAVQARVTRDGVTTLPVRRLFGIIRELSGMEIDLETDEKSVTSIRSGPSFFKIRGLAAEEFPPINAVGSDRSVVIPQEKLRGMLKSTSFAISTDESRYVLNGTFVSLREHKLTMVATDGRRLALADEDVDVPAKSAGDFIIPAKTVGELNRLLQDKGEVEIRLGENQASFMLRGEGLQSTLILTRLIEGSYPNYRQVIPAETKERVPLIREEFLQALRRAQLMTTEKQTSVKLSFERNQLSITANSPEVGEACEIIAINYKGKEMATAFNPTYLIEPLSALETDEVFFELIDELSPGVLKINGPYLYVVMPMRLS